jgi:hypothetical protein
METVLRSNNVHSIVGERLCAKAYSCGAVARTTDLLVEVREILVVYARTAVVASAAVLSDKKTIGQDSASPQAPKALFLRWGPVSIVFVFASNASPWIVLGHDFTFVRAGLAGAET